jgi:hypothetical protein
LLIYKPHFLLGFLVLWLVWREYRALLAAGLVAAIWVGTVLVMYGIDPYIDYFNQIQNLFLLPYGASKFFEATPLALVATVLPVNLVTIIRYLSQAVMIAGLVILAWLAHRLPHTSQENRYALLILASLYPFIASPHVLMYDLAVLAPLLVLWSHLNSSRWLLYLAIGIYQGSILLLLISDQIDLALLGIFPLSIMVGFIDWLRKKTTSLEPSVAQ